MTLPLMGDSLDWHTVKMKNEEGTEEINKIHADTGLVVLTAEKKVNFIF